MDKLKQNPFWVVIGALGIVLIIVFAVLVYPQWDRRSTLQTQIKGLQMQLQPMTVSVPGEPDIKIYSDVQDLIKKHHAEIAAFYKKRDENLESWFDGARSAPQRGLFMGKYFGLRNAIEGKLKEKGIKVGLKDDAGEDEYNWGFNWEIPGDEAWTDIGLDELAVMREIQKRYWARERIANACLAAGVRRVKDVHFFKKLHINIKNPKWEVQMVGNAEIKYPADPINPQIPRDRFTEFDLPGKLGKTMTFGVTVELLYTEVPKFIEKLLSEETGPQILVNVIGCRASVRDQNKPREKIIFTKDQDAKKEQADKDAKEAKFVEALKPMTVQLSLTCQVIDVDADKLEPKKAP